MNFVKVRNVQRALPEGSRMLLEGGVERGSRNGKVLVMPGPVVTTYELPQERVMLWPQRDANPFFHLMESLWMLAGRNDVAWLAPFAKQIAEYSDDGKTFNGAYGYRWRTHFGKDQLTSIAGALQANKECRRQVLAMWDGRQDLNGKKTKDVPCNTQAYFAVTPDGALDLTVCNRSNDMVWGAYGANAVHFSFLLEWMAARVGVPVGRYHQFSNNFHAYEHHWDLMRGMEALAGDPFDLPPECCYSLGEVLVLPLVANPVTWDLDLDTFFRRGQDWDYSEPFFELVAKPVLRAHVAFRNKDNRDRIDTALRCLEPIPDKCDWKVACQQWLERRRS